MTLIVLSSGCATKRQLTPYHGEPTENEMTCRAKAYFDLQTRGSEFQGHAHLLFHLRGQASKLQINFIDPFGMTLAKLFKHPDGLEWHPADARYPDLPPPLRTWFGKAWWQEMAIVFGQMSDGRARLYLDQKGRPAKLISEERSVECFYGPTDSPHRCTIKNQTFEGQINFSLNKCTQGLSFKYVSKKDR